MVVVFCDTGIMETLNIYYLHFGIDNNHGRKREYAASSLHKILQTQKNLLMDGDLLSRLRFLKDVLLNENRYFSDFRFRRCYRNHIYPAEIEDRSSVFYGANIRFLDALLIDRNGSVDHHNRQRGGFKHRSKFYPRYKK